MKCGHGNCGSSAMHGSDPPRCFRHNMDPALVEKRKQINSMAGKHSVESRRRAKLPKPPEDQPAWLDSPENALYVHSEQLSYFCLMLEAMGMLDDPRFHDAVTQVLQHSKYKVTHGRNELVWRVEMMARDGFKGYSREAIWKLFAPDVPMPADLLTITMPKPRPKPESKPATPSQRPAPAALGPSEILWTELRSDL